MNRYSTSLARALALIAPLSAALSCGGSAANHRSTEITLADLRRRGDGNSEARRDRALAELIAPGGDSAAGMRTLEALRAARPSDPRVRFALGVVETQHGDFVHGVSDLAATIDAARSSSDPLASAIAETTIDRLINLRGNVNDFAETFRPVIDAVSRDPGGLNASAVFAIVETGVRWARERGLQDEETRWTHSSGCATQWTVAGPFGPAPMLRFDETLPPETPGPWVHDYDIGAGRGRRPTWNVRARGCAANLGRGSSETGVFIAASDFVLAHDTDAILQVSSPNVFSVIVDGAPIGTLDSRRESTPTRIAIPVALAAGRHTLRVKIASRYSSPLLMASILDRGARPIATFETAASGAHEVPPHVLDDAALRASLDLAPISDPFSHYLRAEQAIIRHQPVEAREALRGMATGDHVPALTLMSWGSIALNDSFVPTNASRDRARRAFDAARRADPNLYYAALVLARLTAADDRADDALQMLRDAYQRFPNNPDVESDLADKLLDRNWDGEAQEILAHAAERLPTACWPLRMQLSISQRHGDGNIERELAGRIARCDRLADAFALTSIRLRRWTDARDEYQRLLDGDPESRAIRRALVDIIRQQGNLADATRRGTPLLTENPEDTSLRSDLVDMQLALGDRTGAMALLDRVIARSTGFMWVLFRLRAALSQREELAPWRLDGPRVLATFNASGHQYDAAAVLVLDYTVRRQFPDGSALELTHNIVRLQSQEGVDEHATFNPPNGALVLTLRTHKADGRVLEPDNIARLDAIAFPDVHIGDAIEFEYVRALTAPEAFPDGFTTDRFYFRGFDVPYDHSELVVVLPREMAAHAVIDPRGAAPRTVRRDLSDALVEYRWLAEQSQRLVPEPRSVSVREFLPSVSIGVNAGWERFIDSIRDRLAEADPFDPAAADLAAEIVGNARRPSEQLARLHRWVTEHIEQERGASAFSSAPVMIAGRSGHRNRALCYLLGLRHIPCRLALVRPGNGDTTETELADDDAYPSLMLRVTTEQGERWVTAAERGAPPFWIPPMLAGQPGIIIAAGAPRVRIPAYDSNDHRREITVRLAIDRDGNGRADVTERLHGSWAVTWREMLRQIDAANLEHEFESYVGHQVTAASLTSLHIDGQDDPNADLVLHYAFTAPGIATARDHGLVFEGVYPAELGPSLAQLPRRTTTLYDGEPLETTLDVTVSLPPGAHVTEMPHAASADTPALRWNVRYENTADGFHFARTISAPPARVEPARYEAFAAAARAIDTAESQRVVVRF